jgi:anthranilate synthase component I
MNILPDFAAFSAVYGQGTPQVLHTRLVADLETPVSAFLKLANGRDNTIFLESVRGGEVRGRYSIIGMKPDLIWRLKDGKAEINRNAAAAPGDFVPDVGAENPLAALRALIAETRLALPEGLPPMAVGLFGYLGYDVVRLVEKLPAAPPDTLGLPDAILIRPSITAIFDNVRDEILLSTPVWPQDGVSARAAFDRARERLEDAVYDLDKPAPPSPTLPPGTPLDAVIESNMTREEFFDMVARAKEYIMAGDIFQVVPSQRFRRPFALPAMALYRALRRLNPSPYLYHLSFPGFAVVGSSPEILVRLKDGIVTIRPIAGTRPRGKTEAEDNRLAEELLADPKERAEHLMLIDLGRNDVGRVAKIGDVKVTDSFFVERYSHVMHIVSDVQGHIRDGLDAVDALAAGLPAGTLTGAPKIRAMQIIDEFEKEKRGGAYAGAVGYFAADGSMDTCIMLRTALVKDGMMYVQAGGGIVADSKPENEYQETVNKAKALISAASEAIRVATEAKRGQ